VTVGYYPSTVYSTPLHIHSLQHTITYPQSTAHHYIPTVYSTPLHITVYSIPLHTHSLQHTITYHSLQHTITYPQSTAYYYIPTAYNNNNNNRNNNKVVLKATKIWYLLRAVVYNVAGGICDVIRSSVNGVLDMFEVGSVR